MITAGQMKKLAREALAGEDFAEELFLPHTDAVRKVTFASHAKVEGTPEWAEMVQQAKEKIAHARKKGYEPAYSAQEYVFALLSLEAAQQYVADSQASLLRLHGDVRSTLSLALAGELHSTMREEGTRGRKLAVYDICAHLLPILSQHPSSSVFYEGGVAPYGYGLQETLGVDEDISAVSKEGARERARALRELTGAHYVLIETGAAPQDRVRLSGKKPQTFVCTLVGDTERIYHKEIDTSLRQSFDAQAAELMFHALVDMYRGE